MIESGLDAATDGTGGGYGKYTGLTVAQIAERFRFLAEEGQGRSARAVLRIVHEQTEARGGLGTQRYLVGIGLLITVAMGVFRLVAPEESRGKVTVFLVASAVVTLLFVFGASTVHRASVRGEAQVREIRRLALLTLEGIVAKPGFEAKPLEREHLKSLGELKKSDPETWRRVSEALK